MERVEGAQVAGRYRLVRKLGSGGMGAVWLAHDTQLDSRCALKLIDPDKAKSEEARLRLQREAKAAAQLRGPHVVDVFDHGVSDGVPYIAMEYLAGEDLAARLDRVGTLDAFATYRIVAEVCRALSRAHGIGIVHRDLKPENIFLSTTFEGEVAKVLDFGIAQHDAYSLEDKATKTGSFLGTPFYVSPEQARGKPTDHRADLWSLGVIVFECLTGKPPFHAEALGELMGLILYEKIPKLSDRSSALAPFDAWWRLASSRDRELRFHSAKEMADALGRAAGLSDLIPIPSIRPRGSVAPGSGTIPTPLPPVPLPVDLGALSGGVFLGRGRSEPDLEFAVERNTDAPVSRTRHSDAPPGFRPELKRRHLVAFLVGGVALGGVLMFGLLGGGSGKPDEVPAAARAETGVPLTQPPLPAVEPPAQAPPTAAPPEEAEELEFERVDTPETSDSAADAPPAEKPPGASNRAHKAPRRVTPATRPAPKPDKPAGDSPDYGI